MPHLLLFDGMHHTNASPSSLPSNCTTYYTGAASIDVWRRQCCSHRNFRLQRTRSRDDPKCKYGGIAAISISSCQAEYISRTSYNKMNQARTCHPIRPDPTRSRLLSPTNRAHSSCWPRHTAKTYNRLGPASTVSSTGYKRKATKQNVVVVAARRSIFRLS